MVQYNKALISPLFGNKKTSTTTEQTSLETSAVTIITGVALADSENGEVLVQIGDPIIDFQQEEDDEVIEVYLDDEDDDSVDAVDEDELAELPGEDDDDEETEVLSGDVYFGDEASVDEDEDEVIADNIDEEGNLVDDPVEVTE